MTNLKFRKTLENKYYRDSLTNERELNCRSGYRLVTINIENCIDTLSGRQLIDDLMNMLIIRDLLVERYDGSEQLFDNSYETQICIDEEYINEFNQVWKCYKNQWIEKKQKPVKKEKVLNKISKSNYYKKNVTDDEVLAKSIKILNTDIVQELIGISKYKINVVNFLTVENSNQLSYGNCNIDNKEINISILSHINESIAVLVDTIAHELAHIVFMNHKKEHKQFTNKIKKIIKYQLKIK